MNSHCRNCTSLTWAINCCNSSFSNTSFLYRSSSSLEIPVSVLKRASTLSFGCRITSITFKEFKLEVYCFKFMEIAFCLLKKYVLNVFIDFKQLNKLVFVIIIIIIIHFAPEVNNHVHFDYPDYNSRASIYRAIFNEKPFKVLKHSLH